MFGGRRLGAVRVASVPSSGQCPTDLCRLPTSNTCGARIDLSSCHLPVEIGALSVNKTSGSPAEDNCTEDSGVRREAGAEDELGDTRRQLCRGHEGSAGLCEFVADHGAGSGSGGQSTQARHPIFRR